MKVLPTPSSTSVSSTSTQPLPRYRAYTDKHFDKIEALQHLSEEQRFEMKVVSSVLPFRVNEFVIDTLIDWSNIPADPIFQLTFPQRGMLSNEHYKQVALALRNGDRLEIRDAVRKVRTALNPHPAGQLEFNLPSHDNAQLDGVQHKYDQTVLFFPSQGQTCHAYCTFCFRWAQFIGDNDLRIAGRETTRLVEYLRDHPEVSDVLFTGGDPMVMRTRNIRAYIEPLLELDSVKTIRIGTKALTYWPQRFVTDEDADDLLRLFEEIVASGKHLALMAHYNHWQELEPSISRQAIARVRKTGAQIRAQGPLLQHINDDPAVWARLWQTQVELGIVPYYFFVERDTGARRYFEVPLVRAWEIYRDAAKQVSGLARTVRGPSMSAHPGKVEIQGVATIRGEKVFVLRFLQARKAEWTYRPFFAKFDPKATWFDQLVPAFGEREFFFEAELAAMETSVA